MFRWAARNPLALQDLRRQQSIDMTTTYLNEKEQSMNFKKPGVLSLFAVVVAFAFTSSVAAQRPDGDLSNKNWRVFNINPDVPKLWDINQAKSLNTGGVGLPSTNFLRVGIRFISILTSLI